MASSSLSGKMSKLGPNTGGMGKVTRGGLTPGKLITSSKDESPLSPAVEVSFLFNPTDYTLKKQNTWQEQNNDQQDGAATFAFTKSGRITLALTLHFDTLMAPESREKPYDVRYHTDKLWKMMERKGPDKPPPLVEFVWGKLTFVSFIASMDQKFTLFRDDGIPVRCEVIVNLTQFDPEVSITVANVEAPQPVTITDASRADLIASLSLGMAQMAAGAVMSAAPAAIATQTRTIMENNSVDNPLSLTTGSQVNIKAGG
jgi:hypothetical protein